MVTTITRTARAVAKQRGRLEIHCRPGLSPTVSYQTDEQRHRNDRFRKSKRVEIVARCFQSAHHQFTLEAGL